MTQETTGSAATVSSAIPTVNELFLELLKRPEAQRALEFKAKSASMSSSGVAHQSAFNNSYHPGGTSV